MAERVLLTKRTRVQLNLCRGLITSRALLVCVLLTVIRAGFTSYETVATANESVNSHAQEPFEAAFQGECGEDVPCQQLCFDLHDGTYECGCRRGFTLFANGYSCIENSHYETMWNANLTRHDSGRRKKPSEYEVFHYVVNSNNRGHDESTKYVLNEKSPDPRARTLSQSENLSSGQFDQELYKPEVEFPIQDKPDKHRSKKVINVEFVSDHNQSSATSTPEFTNPAVLARKSAILCDDIKCRNGGSCVLETGICRCPFGWAGHLCENKAEIRYPRFKGDSYIAVRLIKSDSFRIELEFRPELYEGILLYVGDPLQKGMYCFMTLRNGILEVRYNEGTGVGIIRSEQAVILNSWNRARVTFDNMKGWLQLNENIPQRKPAQGVLSSVMKKTIAFLGGYSNASTSSVLSGFQGCVRSLTINDQFYDFTSTKNHSLTSGANLEECGPGVCNTVSCRNGGQCAALHPHWATCLCPLGFGGERCSNAVDISVPSFDGTAHLQFPGLASSSLTFTEMLIVFLPRSPDGALLYNGYRINGTGDFLSLSLASSFLYLKFDLGTGVNVIKSPKPISLHEWHKVHVTRTGRLGSLQVDNDPPLRIVSTGGYSQLSLPLNLYVGGIPSPKELASGAEVRNSFVGCVQKLVINGKTVKLVEQALSGVNINNCNHPCADKPCENGGTCIPNLNTYSCKCATGFTGSNCSTEIVDMVTRPMFMGTSYLHYINEHILSRLRGQSLQMNLTFRALAPFGLIMWAGSREVDTSSDYFALGLFDGHLRLDYNLGSGPVSLFYNHSRMDDGYWHEVKLVRFKQRGSMTVDSTRTVTAVSPGPLKELNIPNELFIGGMPDIAHYNAGVYHTGLMGCLSSFTLDTKYKIQFLTMAVTGINIQPCV